MNWKALKQSAIVKTRSRILGVTNENKQMLQNCNIAAPPTPQLFLDFTFIYSGGLISPS